MPQLLTTKLTLKNYNAIVTDCDIDLRNYNAAVNDYDIVEVYADVARTH